MHEVIIHINWKPFNLFNYFIIKDLLILSFILIKLILRCIKLAIQLKIAKFLLYNKKVIFNFL